MDMDAATFLMLVDRHGFVHYSGPGDIVAIPGNVAMVHITLDSSSHGLRWQVPGTKATCQTCIDLLQNIEGLGKPELYTSIHQKIKELAYTAATV